MEMIRQRARFVHDESLSRLEDEFCGEQEWKVVKRYQIMNRVGKWLRIPFLPPPSCWHNNTGTATGRGRDRVSGWWQEMDVLQMGCRTHCHKSSRSLEGQGFKKWAIRDLDSNICTRWGKAKGCVISFPIPQLLGLRKVFPRVASSLCGVSWIFSKAFGSWCQVGMCPLPPALLTPPQPSCKEKTGLV